MGRISSIVKNTVFGRVRALYLRKIVFLLLATTSIFGQAQWAIAQEDSAKLLETARQAFADRDYQRSFALYSRLADQGIGLAHYNKGVHLLRGLGTTQDANSALESFISASQLGVIEAQTQVGVIYFEGKAVSRNLSAALDWLSKAAKAGSNEARLHLARMNLSADGIARNESAAFDYLGAILSDRQRGEDWARIARTAIDIYAQTKHISSADVSRIFNLKESDFQPPSIDGSTYSALQVRGLEEEVKRLTAEKNSADRKILESSQASDIEKTRRLAELEAELKRALEARARAESMVSEARNAAEREKVALEQAIKTSTDQKIQRLDVRVLVIGNGDYSGSARLKNPINDARLISAKFREFGFAVQELHNTKRMEMVRALADFSRSSKDADLTIFYFAGHGVQIFGTNYLLPIDVDVDDVAQATLQAISLNTILEQYLPGITRLIFIDACRDNPLSRTGARGAGRGLAPMAVGDGTLISYSTRDGGVALDGENDTHSPFTSALAENIGRREDIALILRRVRQSVMAATNNRQTPWEYGSLTGESIVLSSIQPKGKEPGDARSQRK